MAASALPRHAKTELSIREDVLASARARGLDLSRIAEDAIVAALRREDRDRWLARNAEAIAHQNRLVEEEGAFGDDLRTF